MELDRLKETMAPVFDPRSPGTLYVPADDGLYRSTDGGATWENIGEHLPAGYRNTLVPDPAPGGALYVATEDGLFKWVPRD